MSDTESIDKANDIAKAAFDVIIEGRISGAAVGMAISLIVINYVDLLALQNPGIDKEEIVDDILQTSLDGWRTLLGDLARLM